MSTAMSDVSSVHSEDLEDRPAGGGGGGGGSNRPANRSGGPTELEPHDNEPPSSRAVRRNRAIGPGAAGWEAPRAFNVDELEVSEDTDGSMPPSPVPGDMEEERALVEPQVTMCKWESCAAGEVGNMDLLVEHIHDEHIHARQKRYSCEWDGCGRKGFSHASAYALRAHMRSHTKEKPFYCSLPECDRSFTRSDALAKHMRTIHETEPPKATDPTPKSQSRTKFVPVKLGDHTEVQPARSPSPALSDWAQENAVYETVANPDEVGKSSAAFVGDGEHNGGGGSEGKGENGNGNGILLERKFPPDVHFTEEELALPPAELYQQLLAKLRWSSELNAELESEVAVLMEGQKREWALKECLLEKLMATELTRFETALAEKGKSDDLVMRRIVNGMRGDVDRSPLPKLAQDDSDAAHQDDRMMVD